MKEKEYVQLIELIDVIHDLASKYSMEETPVSNSGEYIYEVDEKYLEQLREKDMRAFKHGFASAYTLLTKGENE